MSNWRCISCRIQPDAEVAASDSTLKYWEAYDSPSVLRVNTLSSLPVVNRNPPADATSSSHDEHMTRALFEPVEKEIIHPVVAVEAVVLGDEMLRGDVAHERAEIEPGPNRLLERR